MVGMRGTQWECVLHGGNACYTVGMRATWWECVVHGGNVCYTVGMCGTQWECVLHGGNAWLYDVIGRNDRMAVISDEINNFSIRVLASALNVPENDQARYDRLMADIAAAVEKSYSSSNRAKVIKPELEQAFDRYGVEVSGGALDEICAGLIADLGNKKSVEASDVKEFFTIYAIAGTQSAGVTEGNGYDMLATHVPAIKFHEDGSISVNGVTFKNYRRENYRSSKAYTMGSRGVEFDAAASLYSSEAMDSTLVTVSDLMESITKYGDCADISAETKKVSAIINRSLEIFDEIDFNKVTATELMSKLGEILDMMKGSKVFGDKMTANMLLAILQSKHFIKPLGVSVKESTNFANKINEMVEGGKFDYLHATGIIADTITVMESAGDNTAKTKEEKKEDTKKLLDTISKDTAEMLSVIVTPSLVQNYGVSAAKSDTVSSTVTELLNNMAKYEDKNDTTGAKAEKEAEAVSTLLDFAITASGSKGSLFNTGSDSKKGALDTTADQFVELIVTSEVVYTTVDDMVYRDGKTDNPLGAKLNSQDTAAVTGAIESYYVKNGGGSELARKLEAVAVMLNVNVDLGR